jgi:hypothetical protein
MRQFVLFVTAVLVMTLVGPAGAQPFADTPATHWAYDAIAALAAKGLIEGYSDGTFKGDRAMTRYEMAMIVARLLARLESIQIPRPVPAPAGQPQVSKADLDMILRLLNEFRSELAAKNVRLSAIEEEINALRARLDAKTVQVSGGAQVRYEVFRFATGDPLNGNPNTGTVPAGGWVNMAREVLRLQFDGGVSPDLRFIAVLIPTSLAGVGGSTGFFAFNSSDTAFPGFHNLNTIDVAFLDWKNALGLPLEVWLGRFGGVPPGPTYPVQFGPFGLLMNTAGDTWEDSTGDSGYNSADGIRVAVNLPGFADLHFQAVAIRIIGNTGAFSYASGEDAFGVDANAEIIKGLRVGVDYVSNSIAQSGSATFSQPAGALSFLYHVYGPGGGSVNPATANCPTAVGAAGITCPAAGNGFGAYAQWDIAEGIHLDAEWAQWNDGVLGVTDSGYQAVLTWEFGQLLKVPSDKYILTVGYQYYGPNFYPPYGAAELDLFGWDVIYPGNSQGLTATLTVTPWPHWTLYADYLSGSNVSNGMSIAEYEVGVIYKLSAGATLHLLYRDLTMGGVDQQGLGRAQIEYDF